MQEMYHLPSLTKLGMHDMLGTADVKGAATLAYQIVYTLELLKDIWTIG